MFPKTFPVLMVTIAGIWVVQGAEFISASTAGWLSIGALGLWALIHLVEFVLRKRRTSSARRS
jgi:uncharacterized membrane protein SirB2